MTLITDDHVEFQPQLPVAYDCIVLRQVESLREKAADLANRGAEEGCLIWCLNQDSARARQKKVWICSEGDLHCSIILRPDFEVSKYYQVLVVAIVSLGNSIASYVSPMTALGYRWPNDVCIAGQKISSVWLDHGNSNGAAWLTVTLSVNILNAPAEPGINAISIRDAQGSTDLDNRLLLESFAREFLKQINNWSHRGYQYIQDQWRVRLQNLDQSVVLHHGMETITGTVRQLDEYGNIEVVNGSGVRKISIQDHMVSSG